MVTVVPFKGFRYNKDCNDDFSKVVAPPYDVMKGEKLDMIQNLSQDNIAWVTKNKPLYSDTTTENQYTRARDILNSLIENKTLSQDDSEVFYVYGQNFSVHGNDHFRFGFIGLLELEDFAKEAPASGSFSGILQHEETLPKDIEDRLNLSRQTLAQFGQIFVIYPDHKKTVDQSLMTAMEKEPLMDIIDHQEVRHRLWVVDDQGEIVKIHEEMKSKYVIIADGHHRYKTALALHQERKDLEGSNYRMLTFVNMANPGLVILPTHRLVQNLEIFDKEKILDSLKKEFTVEGHQTKEEMFGVMNSAFNNEKHGLGLFMDDGYYYSLVLNDIEIMNEIAPEKSQELRQLDVSILHSMILDKILGIDKKKLEQGTMKGGGFVVYIKGIGDAVDESITQVKGGAQAVFFMNPTRIQEVEAVATNFECMPQKSTFFYPKVWTGFTINKIE